MQRARRQKNASPATSPGQSVRRKGRLCYYCRVVVKKVLSFCPECIEFVLSSRPRSNIHGLWYRTVPPPSCAYILLVREHGLKKCGSVSWRTVIGQFGEDWPIIFYLEPIPIGAGAVEVDATGEVMFARRAILMHPIADW